MYGTKSPLTKIYFILVGDYFNAESLFQVFQKTPFDNYKKIGTRSFFWSAQVNYFGFASKRKWDLTLKFVWNPVIFWRNFILFYWEIFFMPGRPTVQILLHVFLRVGAVTCLVCKFEGLNFKLDIQTIICTLIKNGFKTNFHMSYLKLPREPTKIRNFFLKLKGFKISPWHYEKKHHQNI